MRTHTPFRSIYNAKSLIPAAFAVAALFTANTAQAQLAVITASQLTALGPTDAPITGPNNQSFLTYTITVGGQTLTLSNGATAANSKRLLRRDQQGGTTAGANFGGDFDPDATLIANTVGVNTTGSADGLNIAFSSPVSAFGFQFDPDLFLAPTDFTFIVSEGATQTTFTRPGVLDHDQENNTAPFFGIQDTGGNNITSILVFGTAVPNPQPNPPRQLNTRPNDFAVGVLRFNITPTSVPEPGSVALLIAMAATGTNCLARRKRRVANQ